jgi:hypothetical protein
VNNSPKVSDDAAVKPKEFYRLDVKEAKSFKAQKVQSEFAPKLNRRRPSPSEIAA